MTRGDGGGQIPLLATRAGPPELAYWGPASGQQLMTPGLPLPGLHTGEIAVFLLETQAPEPCS